MMEQMKPMDIEKRSFAIITELLGDRRLDPENELVIKRVIHTTADFDYVDNLAFSDHAVQKALPPCGRAVTSSPIPRWPRPGSIRRSSPRWAERYTASCRTRTWRRRLRSAV